METWLTLLFYLLAAHAFFDYAGQGDFMAKAKDHTAGIPGVPWVQVLGAHALIHGAAVAALTGSMVLGLAETVAHATIDYGKSAGWYRDLGSSSRWSTPANHSMPRVLPRRDRTAYHIDQGLHVLCKVAWVLICWRTS